MQPVDDPGRLADNPQPKWEVPLELIEWQPAYAQRGGVQLRNAGRGKLMMDFCSAPQVLPAWWLVVSLTCLPNRLHPAVASPSMLPSRCQGSAGGHVAAGVERHTVHKVSVQTTLCPLWSCHVHDNTCCGWGHMRCAALARFSFLG